MKMYEIPTKLEWIIWGSGSDGQVVFLDRTDTQEKAENLTRHFHKERPGLEVTVEEHNAIIPDRTLPNQNQIEEICWILHGALVMIRNLGHANDHVDTMREIAEVLHETPLEMFNPNTWDWNSTLSRLRELENKYPEARTYGMAKRFEEIYTNA